MPPDLSTRIDQWTQGVVKYGAQHNQRQIRSSGGGMKLRSLPARRGLTEISINPHSRKRKPSAAMDGTDKAGLVKKAGMESGPPKKRGRPPGSKNKGKQQKHHDVQRYDQFGLPRLSPPSSIPDLPSSEPSDELSSSSCNTMSSREGVLTLDRPRPDGAIDMTYLRVCTPGVQWTDMGELKASAKQVPPAVLSLYGKLRSIPPGSIPSELESSYKCDEDTPRKSRDRIPASCYLPPSATPYPSQYLDHLKNTVENVHVKAAQAFRTDAHEKQWGAMVSQLLFEVESWAKEGNITALNVEDCSIEPDEMRPTRPKGPGKTVPTTQNASYPRALTEAGRSIGRRVNWCLGLEIDLDDEDIIRKAWRNLPIHEASLNQCISYIRRYLLIVDFDIKDRVSNREQLVPLAVWESGALLKKRHHGWDTSMPMIGIKVDGHQWECYLFFELDEHLMMLRPINFGTTLSLNGIWQILHGLHILMEWAETEYLKWFKEHIIEGWARDIARQ